MRLLLTFLYCLVTLFANAQSNIHKYIGKYEANGMIVQVTSSDKSLLLLVPGAPPQKLIPKGTNTFKTDEFSDETFIFYGKNNKIEKLVSQRPGFSLELKKIADSTDSFTSLDHLMNLKRVSEHFVVMHGPTDSSKVLSMINELENNYSRILKDLKVDKMPLITVRIYPDRSSFLKGINFPNAPDFVMATAFGTDDIRMVSPNAGVDSEMLMKGVVHEFVHCVHLSIEYAPNNPRWLWEGLAMYESKWFFDPKEVDFIKDQKFPSLDSLNDGSEYMLGYVIIEAVKEIWDFDVVLQLIKNRGKAYPIVKIGNNEFSQKVFQYIYRKYVAK